ncbi:tetratricopeptide repeat protein [bacterium]|nr:tetratricopeptide repeat protein [bacterium]
MVLKRWIAVLLILGLRLALSGQENVSVLFSDNKLHFSTRARFRLGSNVSEEDALILGSAQARNLMLQRVPGYLSKKKLLKNNLFKGPDIEAMVFDLLVCSSNRPEKAYYKGYPHLSFDLEGSMFVPSLQKRASVLQKQSLLLQTYQLEHERSQSLLTRLEQSPADSAELQSLVKSFKASDLLLKGLAEQNPAIQIRHFDQALLLDPLYAGGHYYRGKAYYAMKAFENALEDYQWLLTAYPEWWEVYHLRGLTYGQLEKYTEALADYQVILSHAPDFLPALINRGVAHSKLGHFTEAMADYNKALSIEPDQITVHYNMACVYALQGQSAQAIESLRQILENGFRDTEAIRKDEDLSSLRDVDGFEKLLGSYEKKGLE